MSNLKVEELRSWMDCGQDHQLIDVREPYEVDVCCIGGSNIPMQEILKRLNEIKTDIPVVIYCRSGKRGAAVVDTLARNGFTNARNLEGGILAWGDIVDPDINCQA